MNVLLILTVCFVCVFSAPVAENKEDDKQFFKDLELETKKSIWQSIVELVDNNMDEIVYILIVGATLLFIILKIILLFCFVCSIIRTRRERANRYRRGETNPNEALC